VSYCRWRIGQSGFVARGVGGAKFAGAGAKDDEEFRLGRGCACGIEELGGQRSVVGRVLGGPDALHVRAVERIKDILCLFLCLAVGG
jgi:hypothetical protein